MDPLGEVETTIKDNCAEVEWELPICLIHRYTGPIKYISPHFSYVGCIWELVVQPAVGDERNEEPKEQFLELNLYLRYGDRVNQEYFIGLQGADGQKQCLGHRRKIFDLSDAVGLPHRILSRWDLAKRHIEFFPDGALTVVCTLNAPTLEPSPNRHFSPVSWQQRTVCVKLENIERDRRAAVPELIGRKSKRLSKETGRKASTSGIAGKKIKKEIIKETASEKFINDMKEMMVNGDHSDFLITVKGEEFKLHKGILAARNPYFRGMFEHNMMESKTGTAKIDDCDADTFRSFIHFLYTGQVDSLSLEKVCDLYDVCNKYQEDHLKEKCRIFMRGTMSVENISDYFSVALRYDDEELLQQTTDFFKGHAKQIVRSDKWKAFVSQCPLQANELWAKTLD